MAIDEYSYFPIQRVYELLLSYYANGQYEYIKVSQLISVRIN